MRSVGALVLTITIAFASAAIAQTRPAEKHVKAKDPVCGLAVSKDPSLSSNYKGEKYYFCSKTDMEKFKRDPARYAKRGAGPAPAASSVR